MNSYRVLDLFCGTGGFSKGFEHEGNYQVVFGIDLLKAAADTFRLNHPDALTICGDIRDVAPEKVSDRMDLRRGEIDVIIGGPPCQGFSSIRPHRSSSREDVRNSLFNEFITYVDYFRPPLFVLENVVGLATFDLGQPLELMQEGFKKLGYVTDWRILNAAHYGVPQKRERLILLGAEPGLRPSFPTPSHFCTLDTIGFREKQRMLIPDLFTVGAAPLRPAVTVAEAIDDLPLVMSGETAVEYTDRPFTSYQADRRARSDKLTLHSSTAHSQRMLEIIQHSGPNISSIPSHLISSGFSSCYSRLDAHEPSVTITVNFVHPASNRCIHPTLDRALTPREGARLQSFDDDFQFAGTRTQIVKQIGNAVPPMLGQVLASQVSTILSGLENRAAPLQTAIA